MFDFISVFFLRCKKQEINRIENMPHTFKQFAASIAKMTNKNEQYDIVALNRKSLIAFCWVSAEREVGGVAWQENLLLLLYSFSFE